jgi:hypothetical protein
LPDEVRDRLLRLSDYVRGAKRRLAAGDLSGSHLRGVIDTTITRFEVLLRDMLRLHLQQRDMDYISEVHPRLAPESRKPIDGLTLGQVIAAFRIVDALATEGEYSRLLSAAVQTNLRIINKVRKDLQHYEERDSEARRQKRAESVFLAIEKLLSEPMFDIGWGGR